MARALEPGNATRFDSDAGPDSQLGPASVPITPVSARPAEELGPGTVAVLMETRVTTLYSTLLASKSEGPLVIAGVAVLGISSMQPRMPPDALVDSLASALLEQDDVGPATCLV